MLPNETQARDTKSSEREGRLKIDVARKTIRKFKKKKHPY